MPTMKEPMKKSVSLFTFCIVGPRTTHWISLALILCMVVFGCSDDPEIDIAVVEKRQRDGWAAYDKGDFAAALLHFERVIELDVTHADAHNGMGWAHLSIAHAPATTPEVLVKAQRAFEAAIRSDTSNADAWIGLANTLFLRRENASDFQTALRAIDNALQGDHQTLFRHDYQSLADLQVLSAACYYYLGQTNLARSAVETALQTEPSNIVALSLQNLLW